MVVVFGVVLLEVLLVKALYGFAIAELSLCDIFLLFLISSQSLTGSATTYIRVHSWLYYSIRYYVQYVEWYSSSRL